MRERVHIWKLSYGELLAGLSGLLLISVLFLPWYEGTPIEQLPGSSLRDKVTAWEAFSGADLVLMAVALVAVGVVLARLLGFLSGSRWPFVLVRAGGYVAGLLIAYKALVRTPEAVGPLDPDLIGTVVFSPLVPIGLAVFATWGMADGGRYALLEQAGATWEDGRTSTVRLVRTIVLSALVLGMALGARTYVMAASRAPSASMDPTIEVGQYMLIDRLSLRFRDPELGDVVAFDPPGGAAQGACGVVHRPDQPCPKPTPGTTEPRFMKRVVGTPGDRLAVWEGRVYLNGELQDEPFIEADANCPTCNLPEEIVVPEDHYFMMGDNRGGSFDSRVWGPVPKENIIGKAVLSFWPPGRWGGF